MKRPSLLLATLCAASVCAHAQGFPTSSESAPAGAVDLPSVDVTATRVAQTVDASLSDVTVITRAQIDASGAADVYDLLRGLPGVDVVRSGGPGSQASLFLRGTNSNHVLVLVDGVRAATAESGGVDWSQFPLDGIERIEIVRGPRAAYWGSDAIGGVIQIFTRRLKGPNVAVQYGSYDDVSSSAGIGQWGSNGGFSVQAGLRHVTGFPDTTPDNFSYSPLDDGYRSKNLAAQGALNLGAQTLSGVVNRNDADVEFAGGRSHVVNQTIGANLDGDLTPDWMQHLGIGDDRSDLLTPVYDSFYKSRRQSLSWQNTFQIAPNQQIVAGMDYVREHGISLDTGADAPIYDQARRNEALFAGWHGSLRNFDWELAARHDHNSQFGGATTGSAAAGYRFNSWLRLTANWGEGFSAPGLDELYSPGYFGFYAGNPDLQPERSRSSEAGLELTPMPELDVKLVAYRTDIRDLIDFTGPLEQAINVDRARIDGSELTASWQRDGWHVAGNVTWQNPRDSGTDEPLLRRAKRKGDVRLTRDFDSRMQAGIELYAQGRTQDIGGPLGGFALWNATFGVKLTRAWRLTLRAENLADRNYTVIRGFATPGRSGWIEFIWSPQQR